MKNSSSGNVLFLILIAVALFAALSYAVTQSSRSGSGNASDETVTMNAAALSQFTSSLRSAAQRIVLGGTSVADLEFNKPQFLSSCTTPSVCIFHSNGGGIPYQLAPASLMAGAYNATGEWLFTMNVRVQNVGTNLGGAAAQDVLAILPGIKQSVCTKINQKLGITGMTEVDDDRIGGSIFPTTYEGYNMDHDYIVAGPSLVIGQNSSSDSTGLSGQQEGCYHEIGSDVYVYYSVIYPR